MYFVRYSTRRLTLRNLRTGAIVSSKAWPKDDSPRNEPETIDGWFKASRRFSACSSGMLDLLRAMVVISNNERLHDSDLVSFLRGVVEPEVQHLSCLFC